MGLFTNTPKTVDAAIAGLLKAQTDLERVAEDRNSNAAELRQTAGQLIAQAEGDEREATRARNVLGKLKAITEE